MTPDPRIDGYIEKAAPFAQPILHHLRELIHQAVPGLTETLKWSMPHFTHQGKNLAGLAAFKAHCAMMIHGDGRQGDAMGQYGKITQMSDLPSDNALIASLQDAKARIEEAGTALKKKPAAQKLPKPELPIPAEFAAALASNPSAKAALDGFAPSHRREYVDWITEAKRDDTRAKRIAQAIEWLSEGKKRNWKYENC